MTDANSETIIETLVDRKLQAKAEVDAIFDNIEKQVEAQDTVAGGLTLFISLTAKFFAARALAGDSDAVMAGAERLDATATLIAEAMIENTEVDPAGDGPSDFAVTKLGEIGNNTAAPAAAEPIIDGRFPEVDEPAVDDDPAKFDRGRPADAQGGLEDVTG